MTKLLDLTFKIHSQTKLNASPHVTDIIEGEENHTRDRARLTSMLRASYIVLSLFYYTFDSVGHIIKTHFGLRYKYNTDTNQKSPTNILLYSDKCHNVNSQISHECFLSSHAPN